MPSSSLELIDNSLHNAFGKVKKEHWEGKNSIQDQLHASSKQIFLHDIEYEKSHCLQSYLLDNLKCKYVQIISANKKSNSNNCSSNGSKMAQGSKDDKLSEPCVTLWPSDKVILGWRKNYPPGAGFSNLGNTCYMNSSLQALFHIPSMANWLLEEINSHIPNCERNSENASFCSICGMMKTLRISLDRANTVIKPSLIHNKLKCIGKTLMYGRQEDAHEFIKMLIDHMERSFLVFKRALKLDHRSKETTPLNQIFGGYLRQQVICPLCSYVSTTFSHFQDIVLDIRSVGSVDEALSLYFRKETIDSDNAYKCEKCRRKVPATMRHLIEKVPPVLLLQLKRFTMSGGKITKHINIERTIDISKYVNGSRNPQSTSCGTYSYKLVSMVIHIGSSQHGGHYTAIAEASNNTLFEFDDSSVRPISLQSALLRNPYILFYELVRPPKDSSTLKHPLSKQSSEVMVGNSSNERLKTSVSNKNHLGSLNSNSLLAKDGYSSSNNDVGEVFSRSSLVNGVKHSSIPSIKERDKVSFGLKTYSNMSRMNGVLIKQKPKINGSNSSLTNKNLSCSSSSSSKSTLVPYAGDSDESDSEKDIESSNSKPSDSNVKDCHSFERKKNGVSTHLAKENQSKSQFESPYKYNNGKFSSPFIPRNIQIHSQNSKNDCDNANGLKQAGQRVKSDATYVNKRKECSSVDTKNGNAKYLKRTVSDSVHQNYNGWKENGVTERSNKDKSSYENLNCDSDKRLIVNDSENRVDKTGKSMKESFFSLLPCLSSSTSSNSPNCINVSSKNPSNSDTVQVQFDTKTDLRSNGSSQLQTNGNVSKRNHSTDHFSPNSSKDTNGTSHINGNGDSTSFRNQSKYASILKSPSSNRNQDSSPTKENDSSKHNQNSNVQRSKSVHTVEWNRNVKDLADTLPSLNKSKRVENSFARSVSWNGSNDSSVVNSLKKSGEFRFGTRVETWNGEDSLLDQQAAKDRNEARKKTADDIYNDELDQGKLPKFRKHLSDDKHKNENLFQKYQNQFINSADNSSGSYNRDPRMNKNSPGQFNNNNFGGSKFGRTYSKIQKFKNNRSMHSHYASHNNHHHSGHFHSSNTRPYHFPNSKNKPKHWYRRKSDGDYYNHSIGRRKEKSSH